MAGANIPYPIDAFLAAVRVSLWFILLFGFLAPLFLKHVRDLPIIEKMIYSWTGLGGIIIFTIFVLTSLNIYDFIGFILTLLLIPAALDLWKNRKLGVLQYFQKVETRLLILQLRFIEKYEEISWEKIKNRIPLKDSILSGKVTKGGLVIFIAAVGGIIRMYPALMNAAPFSRNWFADLNRIKTLRLQDYFMESPEPGGLHALVSVFSMLTQLSPEIILHLLGALTSFFLCIIVYWGLKDITKNKQPMAPVFGMALYALTPMLLMPISLDQQIEANSVDLALCFAIPTLTIFIRNLRRRYKSPWFYILSGFVATGMTNLFVAFVILLPLLILGSLSLPRGTYFRFLGKLVLNLLLMSLVVLGPLFVYGWYHDVDLYMFFLEQLYATEAYTYNPSIILPLNELSSIYLLIAGVLLIGYLLEFYINENNHLKDEVIFLVVFIILAFYYSSLVDLFVIGVDQDQLNGFYALTIAFLAGICFAVLMRLFSHLLNLSDLHSEKIGILLLPICLSFFIYLQGGVKVSRQLPSTMPNGFMKSYYNIIDDFLPFSYATVGPKIERINAKNRHFFMNYDYFLDRYDAIDSLYQQQLSAMENEGGLANVPPANIFVFVEKPPYGSIQQGILYDAGTVMRDLEQWFTSFRKLENRTVKVYYEDYSTLVYQIQNRDRESRVNEVLFNVHPGWKRKSLLDE